MQSSSAVSGYSKSGLILIIGVLVLFSCPAQAEVLKVVINDTIQPISAEYIARALDEARRRNDQAVLIEMNTPGGVGRSSARKYQVLTAMREPCSPLEPSQAKNAIGMTDNGRQFTSGGLLDR